MIAPGAKASHAQLRAVRRTRPVGCPEHLIVALPWVSYEANLGTLLRTCDAVGACMAVPSTSTYKSALVRGDTLSRRKGARILAVELADDAVPLASLGAARQRTVVLLGHEHNGVPDEAWPLIDTVVEIPMETGSNSRNGPRSPARFRNRAEPRRH